MKIMIINRGVPFTYLFKKIRYETFIIILFSFFVGYLDNKFVFIAFPVAAPTILGTTISLLLAFRTAQAYDRWWEARIIWGSIVNNTRNLVREIQAFYGSDDLELSYRLEKNTKIVIAWSYALGESLRGLDQIKTLEKYLSSEDIEKVKHHRNIPNALLSLLVDDIRDVHKKGLINDFQQVQLMRTIDVLCDCMGMCERIKTTVFPRSYSTILHSLIYVFAVLFPFSLTNYPIYVEEILNILISSSFFLIEKTAVYIQDPFENRPTDIAVSSIARIIEINLSQMLKTSNLPAPEPLEAKGFYLM